MTDWALFIFVGVMGFLGGVTVTLFFVRDIVIPIIFWEWEKQRAKHDRSTSASGARRLAGGFRGGLFVVPSDDNLLVPPVHDEDVRSSGKENG